VRVRRDQVRYPMPPASTVVGRAIRVVMVVPTVVIVLARHGGALRE
jgi:hypothetical protein